MSMLSSKDDNTENNSAVCFWRMKMVMQLTYAIRKVRINFCLVFILSKLGHCLTILLHVDTLMAFGE